MNVIISRALVRSLLNLLDVNREEMSNPQQLSRLHELLLVDCMTYRLGLLPVESASLSQNSPSAPPPPTVDALARQIGSLLSDYCRQYGQPYYSRGAASVGNPGTSPRSHPPLVERLADYGNLLQCRQKLQLGSPSSTPTGGTIEVRRG